MPTACTSSEEKNTPYLRQFGHNIKNNDEGRVGTSCMGAYYVLNTYYVVYFTYNTLHTWLNKAVHSYTQLYTAIHNYTRLYTAIHS